MLDGEKIKEELENRFNYLKDAVIIKRESRIFAQIPLEKFEEVFRYLVKQSRFDALSAITGLDSGNGFTVIYHLHREGKILVNLKVDLNKEKPAVNTVTSYFPGADNFERELIDLLGIAVNGLAAGNSYPLPDNWPKGEHPLRKDWKGRPSASSV